jgi:hypothetical protein
MAWGGTNGQYYSDRANPEFDDPVQGTACPNCSFVAGLSALAWVNPAYVKGNILNALNQIKFYNWPDRAQPWGFSPNIWAPSAEFCHSSEANELWPAYYEKAYASCALNTHGDPADKVAYIGSLGGSASVTALNRITPNQWSFFGPWVGDFYTSINTLLSGASPYPNGAGSSRQAKYPILVATGNHTYSVLGTYTNAAQTTYIILRNPNTGGAPGGVLLAGPWWVNYRTYAGGQPTSDPIWTAINLANGVFGIEKGSFAAYFQSYTKVNI